MTVKQFFKSQAFKCIAVLMSILLVCGVLLAVCWGFLEVTDEERFNRKIGTIYGGDTVKATAQDLSGKNLKVSGATIENLWYIEQKNDYLVQASSKGNGGDVTCWITVNMEGDKTVKGVGKVLLYSVADAAEFKDNISAGVYDKFATDYVDGKEFSYGTESSPDYIHTGASRTLTAICNDVNAAVAFVKAYVSGVNIERDYTRFIDKTLTTWEIDGETVKYDVHTTGEEPYPFQITIHVDASGTITEYVIVHNGSSTEEDGAEEEYADIMSPLLYKRKLIGKTLEDIEGYLDNKDGVLETGATRSNTVCFEAAAYALTEYAKIMNANEGGNE